MGPIWGRQGRPHVGPWTLLSGIISRKWIRACSVSSLIYYKLFLRKKKTVKFQSSKGNAFERKCFVCNCGHFHCSNVRWAHGVLNHRFVLPWLSSKKISKLRITGPRCEEKPPVIGTFPSQRTSNAKSMTYSVTLKCCFGPNASMSVCFWRAFTNTN